MSDEQGGYAVDSWERNTRDEALQRSVRDAAVHDAMTIHDDHLRGEIDRRLVHEIAALAVHNALTMYAANFKQDLARIESFNRARYERAERQNFAQFIATGTPIDLPASILSQPDTKPQGEG